MTVLIVCIGFPVDIRDYVHPINFIVNFPFCV